MKDAWKTSKERKDVVKYLKTTLKDWGDTDWDYDLHLVDILDKHLFDYLYHDFSNLDAVYKSKQDLLTQLITKVEGMFRDYGEIKVETIEDAFEVPTRIIYNQALQDVLSLLKKHKDE